MNSLSVVIRTFNSELTLKKVLLKLDLFPGDEIVIVDSGSTDRTLEIAKAFSCEILRLPAKDFSYGRALNLGFSHAKGKWILALSSHSIPAVPFYLASYHAAIDCLPSSVACAVAPLLYCKEEWHLKQGVTLFSELETKTFIPGGNTNALYRRELWQRHPFDETLPGAEDHEWILWSIERGCSLAMIHNVPVFYRPSRSLKKSFLKGRWDRVLAEKSEGKTTLFRHDLLFWTGQILLKVLLGRISLILFLHIIAQKLGNLSARFCRGEKESL